MSSITHNSIETEEIIKALRKENESLRMMGSPVVEATIQHQAMEIMKLKETVATLNESLSITSQGNAALRQQVATLQGIEAIANEYGIDGFVEIEELHKQVAELQQERDELLSENRNLTRQVGEWKQAYELKLKENGDNIRKLHEIATDWQVSQALVAELRSALKHYGWHEDDCDAINKSSDCDCGYDEALARTAREE